MNVIWQFSLLEFHLKHIVSTDETLIINEEVQTFFIVLLILDGDLKLVTMVVCDIL